MGERKRNEWYMSQEEKDLLAKLKEKTRPEKPSSKVHGVISVTPSLPMKNGYNPLMIAWVVSPYRKDKRTGYVGKKTPVTPYHANVLNQMLRKFYPDTSTVATCEPTCPHCGKSSDYLETLCEITEIECWNCDEKYIAEDNKDGTFTSYKGIV